MMAPHAAVSNLISLYVLLAASKGEEIAKSNDGAR